MTFYQWLTEGWIDCGGPIGDMARDERDPIGGRHKTGGYETWVERFTCFDQLNRMDKEDFPHHPPLNPEPDFHALRVAYLEYLDEGNVEAGRDGKINEGIKDRILLDEGLAVAMPSIDRACRYLVYQLNQLDGIETIFSCSGHGQRDFYIEFILSDVKALETLFWLIGGDPGENAELCELPWGFSVEPVSMPFHYGLRVRMFIEDWGESCADELAESISEYRFACWREEQHVLGSAR